MLYILDLICLCIEVYSYYEITKQIFDKVKWDIRIYSVELVIFNDVQWSRISTKRN